MTVGLEAASKELRAAVIAADHAGAERAVCRYVEVLREMWEGLSDEHRKSSTLPKRAHELLAWARQMTIIQRSLAADQLRVIQKASRYHPSVISNAGLQVRG